MKQGKKFEFKKKKTLKIKNSRGRVEGINSSQIKMMKFFDKCWRLQENL